MTPQQWPTVTVVVCAFNEEKLIRTCIAALCVQDYPESAYEILVVDDESDDGTFGIVSGLARESRADGPEIRLFRIRHGGLSVARNAGIRLARGSVLAFIDGDAVPDPGWLRELVRPFLSGADYVGGRIDLLNTESPVARFLQRTRHRQFFGPRIFNDQCIGCNMAFRREVFEAVGGFHENFVSRGDESTLQERIRGRFGYRPAPDAVVRHERPDTLGAAWRVTWKSATLAWLSRKAAGKGMTLPEWLLVGEQLWIALLPVTAFAALAGPAPLAAPFLLSVAAAGRRFCLRPLNRAIAAGLVEEYGPLHGIAAHFAFCYVFDTLSLAGQVAGPFLHRSERIVPPMTTALEVLATVRGNGRMDAGGRPDTDGPG